MDMSIMDDLDKPKSFCGIFGAFGTPEASLLTYYGLHALQHRGQEASGIVSCEVNSPDKSTFHIFKGDGLVSEVFHAIDDWGKELVGTSAIGHNRYSTTGSSLGRKNIQPFHVHYHSGNMAIAHNGNLTNERELRDELVSSGSLFQTTSDTEVMLHLIAKSKLSNPIEQIKEALGRVEGAYCFLFLTDTQLIAARDPFGFRPLALGKKDGGFVVASETCAFDIIEAEYIRDIEPGEMVIIDNNSLEKSEVTSIRFAEKLPEKKQCIFEYIYFSRPDSRIFGSSVDKIRRRLGKVLAQKHSVQDPDGEKVVVISVPDSSNTAALGYASELEKMGIRAKFELGLIRSHYIGRTFIQPGQNVRERSVREKFNPVKGVLENKTVVIVDDSIVRGTTSKFLVKLLREAKPKSIHMRISSPPILFPCYYGMDFPSKQELIANKMGSIENIREFLGVDSLEYLTTDELATVVHDSNPSDYCFSCFSGSYPTKVNENFKKDLYES